MSSERNIEIAVSYVRDIHDAKIADFGTRMIMIPSLGKQNGTLELTSSDRCRSGSRSRRSSRGDENNSESKTDLRKKTEEYSDEYDGNYKVIDGPIDLSASTNMIKTEPDRDVTNNVVVKLENEEDDAKMRLQKNKQKKRKAVTGMVNEECAVEHLNERIPKQTVSKKEEVLKAARSLFSKRTRTLYHWMYPDTSKGKLKSIVSAAWDTLSTTEKEFYVSQVLGRFGVPAGSLMVNPQLGGFQNREASVSSTMALLAGSSNGAASHEQNLTYRSPTSSHGQDEYSGVWSKKRWRKHINNEDYVARQQHNSLANVIDAVYDEDEFADDPELTTELLQFRRAMGNVD